VDKVGWVGLENRVLLDVSDWNLADPDPLKRHDILGPWLISRICSSGGDPMPSNSCYGIRQGLLLQVAISFIEHRCQARA
jgi:hypothetical protein